MKKYKISILKYGNERTKNYHVKSNDISEVEEWVLNELCNSCYDVDYSYMFEDNVKRKYSINTENEKTYTCKLEIHKKSGVFEFKIRIVEDNTIPDSKLNVVFMPVGI